MTTDARLAESQQALKNIVLILNAITGGTDRNVIFYEIGRATMTAKLAIREPQVAA